MRGTKHKARGFTIVELLIVIVIIAILAAVTLVAYNGITTRANQSANQSTVASYVRVLQLIKADTGSLPDGNNANSSCLGPDPQPSSCGQGGQTASTASTATTKSLLAKYGLVSQPGIKGGADSDTWLVYSSNFFGEPALLWQIPPNQECTGSAGRFRQSSTWVDGVKVGDKTSTVTRCSMSLRDI